MNYIRKRRGHGFTGTYAAPYGGKVKRSGIKNPTYHVYNGPKTKYYKGSGVANQDKTANIGAYVV